MSKTKKKRYTVRFYEWTAHRATVQATSAEAAMRAVHRQYIRIGSEEFDIWDNGSEDWTVDCDGKTVLEIDHPEMLEDDCASISIVVG